MTAPVASRGERPLHLGATAAVAALTAVTAVTMCRLFVGWAFLGPMLVVIAVGHLAALGLRALRVPSILAIPLALLLVGVAVAQRFHGSTMWGILPTGDTLDAIRSDLRLVTTTFRTTVAPVPSQGAYAAAGTALIGLCAPLADAFAFRAYGRAEATVPTLVVFVLSAALGADRNRIAVATVWIGTAIAVTAILRAAHRAAHEPWVGGWKPQTTRALPAVTAVAVVAALTGGLLARHLPGAGEPSLLDVQHRKGGTTQLVNPLVDLRPDLVNRSNVELFTVQADAPGYWRLMGLDLFDGVTWNYSEETLDDAHDRDLVRSDGQSVGQTITITGLRGKLIPALYAPARFGDSGGSVVWASTAEALIADRTSIDSGDVFNITSRVQAPTADQLQQATVDDPPRSGLTDLPASLPRVVRRTAAAATQSASTPYAKALALQSFFRDNFTYDLHVPAGNGGDALVQFLQIRRGYCEQFSAAFAAMARSVGLPARVAVGFTPGNQDSTGVYHVLGRHAHAWPEVWFDGIGWVAFEPTPGRGAPGNESATGVSPEQDETTPPTTPPADTTPSSATVSSAPPDTTAGGATTSESTIPPTDPIAPDGPTSPWWWLLVLPVALVAWTTLMPLVVRRRRHPSPHDPPSAQLAGWWQNAVAALAAVGWHRPPGTPAVELAAEASGTPARQEQIAELASLVTDAMYGDRNTAEAARRAALLSTSISGACHRSRTWRQRLVARLDPRRVI